jgi:hypothetical protein
MISSHINAQAASSIVKGCHMQRRCLRAVSRWQLGPQYCRSLHDPTGTFGPATRSTTALRTFHTRYSSRQDVTALRKELKDEKRASRSAKCTDDLSSKVDSDDVGDWRLTVGIEIHAQLNTARKLFSCTRTLKIFSLPLICSRCLN